MRDDPSLFGVLQGTADVHERFRECQVRLGIIHQRHLVIGDQHTVAVEAVDDANALHAERIKFCRTERPHARCPNDPDS